MKKVLFVNPPVGKDFFGNYAGVVSKIPQLGILFLASSLRKKGYEVKIVDAYNLGITPSIALSKVKLFNPDYVCITANTEYIDFAASFAKKIKSWNKSLPIIIGGPHLNNSPIETMNKYSCFDYGFIGEGEKTLSKFLDTFSNDVPGLIYREKNKIIENKIVERIKELDKLPFPSFDLLEGFPEKYQPTATNFKTFPSTGLTMSRGCPWNCSFCDRSVFGNEFLYHNPNYVVSIIKHLKNIYGVKDVCFYDDLFTIPNSRIRKFCKLMISKKVDISWSCLSRIDCVDKKTLSLMKQAGCWQISYGVESGSQRILDVLNKSLTIEKIKKTIKDTKKEGINVRGFFIIGSPHETEDDIKKTWSLIKETKIDDLELEFFTPISGTKLELEAKKHGSFDKNWKEANMLKVNFVPDTLTKKKLEYYHRKIIRDFYTQPRIIKKYLIKMLDYNQVKFLIKGLKTFVKVSFFKK